MMDTNRKGALVESIAITWLLSRGYTVFKNVSAHGLADLIAWKPGEAPILFDAKIITVPSARPHQLQARNLSAEQKRAGVKPLYVDIRSGAVLDNITPMPGLSKVGAIKDALSNLKLVGE